MADRGAVILWAASKRQTNHFNWTWDEGATTSQCTFGSHGEQSVYAVSSSPSRDGLRFHLLTMDSETGKHYVLTVDFSSLSAAKCVGIDKPDTPQSHYETWIPSDPDGVANCLLGQQTTYVRRKANIKCFNVDNDLTKSTVPCLCEREDYECDDCYVVSRMFDKTSKCVKKAGPCFDEEDPCANGQTTYYETKGYRKIPFDQCKVPPSSNEWEPVLRQCSDRTTVAPVTTVAPSHTTTSVAVSHTTSAVGATTTEPTETTEPASPSNAGLYAAVAIVLILLVGAVVGFMVLRKNVNFRRRFGGRCPGFLVQPLPQDNFSTLGEVSNAQSYEDDDF